MNSVKGAMREIALRSSCYRWSLRRTLRWFSGFTWEADGRVFLELAAEVWR